MHTIITENDESQWDDETGFLYHFPKRYAKHLLPGTNVIYYKGKLKNPAFKHKRLTTAPHYFAKAVIGNVYADKESSKGDLFATIVDFTKFHTPILAKTDGDYLEVIPESQKSNYWRNGVRSIQSDVYEKILSLLGPEYTSEPSTSHATSSELNDLDNLLESGTEGRANKRYVTTYERNPKYRKQALAIHGFSCFACGFNFGEFYGDYANGYIHVHHVNPVSELEAPRSIDPETELVPLCANCHSVVHRNQSKTLSIKELIEMIESAAQRSKEPTAKLSTA